MLSFVHMYFIGVNMQTDRELIELAAKAAGIQESATENVDEFNF